MIAHPTSHDPLSSVIVWVTVIFSCAIFGRYLARCLNQPGVLGELLMGVLLGNLGFAFDQPLMVVLREGSSIFSIIASMLAGSSLDDAVRHTISDPKLAFGLISALSGANGIEYIKVAYVLDMFSRFGVIFLLFMVGLESSISELRHTGREAIRVALIGVISPIILGFIVATLLVPESTYQINLFVAATLSATSIGITARVLSEMKQLRTREARTILGAAMLDDVLGLVILALVSSIVLTGRVYWAEIAYVCTLTALFFAGVLWLGPWFLRKLIPRINFLNLWEAKLFVSFFFVMVLSWLATVVGLASIIGAFAAGMIINDQFFETEEKPKHRLAIQDLVAPLEFILAPIFFMLIGIQVKLEMFFNTEVLILASGLIAVAIVGKLISGWGASRKDDRLLIGIGMLPRGEVGLVFASIGKTLGVMSDQLFAAIVLMVIVTTILTPPLLTARFARKQRRNA